MAHVKGCEIQNLTEISPIEREPGSFTYKSLTRRSIGLNKFVRSVYNRKITLSITNSDLDYHLTHSKNYPPERIHSGDLLTGGYIR
jgi:hypothetical protein